MLDSAAQPAKEEPVSFGRTHFSITPTPNTEIFVALAGGGMVKLSQMIHKISEIHFVSPLVHSGIGKFDKFEYEFSAKIMPIIQSGMMTNKIPNSITATIKEKVQSIADSYLPQQASKPGNGNSFKFTHMIEADGTDYNVEYTFAQKNE